MIGKGHALARDELIRVLTAYTGVTTEDGLLGGTTLIDINLKDNPSISANAIPEKTILIMSGDAIMEDKGAASFVNATGTITLQGTGFSTKIKAGTIFRILNISTVEIDVVNGTESKLWNTAEQDLVSLGAATIKKKLHSLLIDINNLVGTITVRLYMEINNIERRVYQQNFTVAADGPGLWIVNGTVGIHEVLRVTLQSDNAADDNKDVNYDYMLEEM